MKTTIILSDTNSKQCQIFNDFSTFMMCISFWLNTENYSPAELQEMYQASRRLICKVECKINGLTVTFDTQSEMQRW